MRPELWKILVIGLIFQPVLQAGDPTRPDNSAVKSSKGRVLAQQLQLTMVQITESGPRATINGQVVTTGDQVGGYRVVAIRPNEVILQNNQDKVRLSLIKRGAIRKSSS